MDNSNKCSAPKVVAVLWSCGKCWNLGSPRCWCSPAPSTCRHDDFCFRFLPPDSRKETHHFFLSFPISEHHFTDGQVNSHQPVHVEAPTAAEVPMASFFPSFPLIFPSPPAHRHRSSMMITLVLSLVHTAFVSSTFVSKIASFVLVCPKNHRRRRSDGSA